MPVYGYLAFSKGFNQGLDLVLRRGDSPVRDYGFESGITLERGVMKKQYFTDFGKGVICGALAAIIVFGVIAGLMFFNNQNKELIKYAEKQIEIEKLREDIITRNPDEFLEIPGVRRAADGAAAEFDRRREEILHRFRSRLSSRARLAD